MLAHPAIKSIRPPSVGVGQTISAPRAEIKTVTGRMVNLMDPTPEDISLTDIVIPLSKICRYGSHLPLETHASVAQHSIYVSRIAGEMAGDCAMTRLAGLLHDGSEAYIADIVRPVKPHLPDYQAVERHLQETIFEAFGVSKDEDVRNAVHAADTFVLWMEMIEMGKLSKENAPYTYQGKKAGLFEVFPDDHWMSPREAHDAFLAEYDSVLAALKAQRL